MHNQEKREYNRLRLAGWPAAQALRAARTNYQFKQHECGEHDRPDGDAYAVRLQVLPDEGMSLDDLLGDCYDTRVNPDVQPSRMARERQAEIDHINNDGVWYVVGQFWNGDAWIDCDGCGGFIGDDWRESGYDTDIKQSALDALREFNESQLLQGAI